MSWKKAVRVAAQMRREGWKATATWRNGRPVVLSAKRVSKRIKG